MTLWLFHKSQIHTAGGRYKRKLVLIFSHKRLSIKAVNAEQHARTVTLSSVPLCSGIAGYHRTTSMCSQLTFEKSLPCRVQLRGVLGWQAGISGCQPAMGRQQLPKAGCDGERHFRLSSGTTQVMQLHNPSVCSSFLRTFPVFRQQLVYLNGLGEAPKEV